MLQLEEHFYNDQLRQELEEQRALEQQEIDSIAAAWLEQQQQGSERRGGEVTVGGEVAVGDDQQVWCPVCRSNWVQQHMGVLFCPCRQLHLDGRGMGVSLTDLRRRLDTLLQVVRVLY